MSILTSRAARRENRARFWDSISRNSAQLVGVYSFLIARGGYPEGVLEQRREECIRSGRNAMIRAERIRSGLE